MGGQQPEVRLKFFIRKKKPSNWHAKCNVEACSLTMKRILLPCHHKLRTETRENASVNKKLSGLYRKYRRPFFVKETIAEGSRRVLSSV